jgi:hypothetical protein
VNTTGAPLGQPRPAALVVPPGEIAVGSTSSCFGGGAGTVVVVVVVVVVVEVVDEAVVVAVDAVLACVVVGRKLVGAGLR